MPAYHFLALRTLTVEICDEVNASLRKPNNKTLLSFSCYRKGDTTYMISTLRIVQIRGLENACEKASLGGLRVIYMVSRTNPL